MGIRAAGISQWDWEGYLKCGLQKQRGNDSVRECASQKCDLRRASARTLQSQGEPFRNSCV